MLNFVQNKNYRKDIDGLRAIAVLAVILFHFGCLPNGFLGVDVFFVISGFLITGIIVDHINANQFSILNFYLRRTRRIIPLAAFVSLVALVVGIATMLPDDLENLAQSVIATNFFANNILQAVTTKNYWDVVNEYKPLMHTWSLGVEEQYYLVYPFLIAFIAKRRPSWMLPIIACIAMVSFLLFLLPIFEQYQKFYLIFFRFWELAAGGIVAILLGNRLIKHSFSFVLILSLIGLLCIELSFVSSNIKLLSVVVVTSAILATSSEGSAVSRFLLETKWIVAAGKISFSLYMWHQLLLAYSRYFWVQDPQIWHYSVIFVLTVAISTLSYCWIEQPFRRKETFGTKALLGTLGLVFFLTTGVSAYVYLKAGVLKDVPELGIRRCDAQRNIHARYNSRVYDFDNNFSSENKIRILAIGNSFARDWVNVLLESKFAPQLEISYISEPSVHLDLRARSSAADVIFYSCASLNEVRNLSIPENKIWAVGTKNFGTSNGFFYNNGGGNYYLQRTPMEHGTLDFNEVLRKEWRGRFLDYVEKVIDANLTVPVFTPSRQFISQDCRHLTKAGAQYFSQLFERELAAIFSNAANRSWK